MATRRTIIRVPRFLGILFTLYAVVLALVYFRQRALLFFPAHTIQSTGLTPWREAGRAFGFCREVIQPRTIWLMFHGNAGQAADRDYVLPCLTEADSLYVLEYPGYGARAGIPGREAINQAATDKLTTDLPGHENIQVLGGESDDALGGWKS